MLAYLQRIAMATLESEPLDAVVRVSRTLEIMSENRVTGSVSDYLARGTYIVINQDSCDDVPCSSASGCLRIIVNSFIIDGGEVSFCINIVNLPE